MQIRLNGDVMHIADNLTLATFLSELKLPEQGVAVAVNQQIKPRSEWGEYHLQENDSVLIIKAACGG